MINSQQICPNWYLRSGHKTFPKSIYVMISHKCYHNEMYKYSFLMKYCSTFLYFFIHFTWLIQIHLSEFSYMLTLLSLPSYPLSNFILSVMVLALFYYMSTLSFHEPSENWIYVLWRFLFF